jgi:kinesin family protein 5
MLTQEITVLKRQLLDAQTLERDAPSPPSTPDLPATQEEMESKKKIRLAQMMTEFDPSTISSDKEAQMKVTLSELASLDASSSIPTDPVEIAEQNRQLSESRAKLTEQDQIILDLTEKLAAAQTVSTESSGRKQELEDRLVNLEEEYEQLLDQHIQEEEDNGGDEALAQAIAEMKEKIEMQYRTRSEVLERENEEMRFGLEEKANIAEGLQHTIAELQIANSNLQSSSHMNSSFSLDSGETSIVLDEEVDRMRKNMSQQLSEFDVVKKKLLRDLQDRLEKIVDLEFSLTDARDQYKQASGGGADKIDNLEASLDEARKNVSLYLLIRSITIFFATRIQSRRNKRWCLWSAISSSFPPSRKN